MSKSISHMSAYSAKCNSRNLMSLTPWFYEARY